jgi:hypothetical protein
MLPLLILVPMFRACGERNVGVSRGGLTGTDSRVSSGWVLR